MIETKDKRTEFIHLFVPVIGLCTARLGLEAPALAWLEAALALSNLRPGQSRHSRLGSGLAWPRPRLYMKKYFIFCNKIQMLGTTKKTLSCPRQ